MTTGDIADHLADVYGTYVSRELVSKVTDAVVGEKAEWQLRPLNLGQFLVIVANQLAMRWRRHRLMNYRCRPRVFKLRRNVVQNASSSLSPTSKPRTSRRPSAAAPVATTTAWDTTQ
jgi:hypothetical protein